MKINAAWQTMNLDNKYSGSFYLPEWNISMYGHKTSRTSIKMMRGELRGEIFACLRAGGRAFRQVEQGIVTEEGKI